MKQKLLDFIERVQQFLLTIPFVIGLLKVRDEISEKLRLFILAFFDFLSPCWTFLFIKKPKSNKDGVKSRRKTILASLKSVIPDPFSDQPSDNGPTSSKSNRSKSFSPLSNIDTFFEHTIVSSISTRQEKSYWQKGTCFQ